MAQATNIEWTDQSWNFLRGCRRVSPGCENCYAERQAIRLHFTAYRGLVKPTLNGPQWTGKISFHEDILLAPLKRRTPTKYFVNSMSDLFYEDVTDEMLDKAFAVMALCPQHIFQILTKRPERMKQFFHSATDVDYRIADAASKISRLPFSEMPLSVFDVDQNDDGTIDRIRVALPLPNVWLGVSVENQEYADKRIPLLLDTPAAVRWISAEPLLGPIDLTSIRFMNKLGNEECWNVLDRLVMENGVDDRTLIGADDPILDWVVVGGESGPRSRKCDLHWIRSIVADCKAAGVPAFVKQLGANAVTDHRTRPDGEFSHIGASLRDRKGGNPDEWPIDLRVREYPKQVSSDIAL